MDQNLAGRISPVSAELEEMVNQSIARAESEDSNLVRILELLQRVDQTRLEMERVVGQANMARLNAESRGNHIEQIKSTLMELIGENPSESPLSG